MVKIKKKIDFLQTIQSTGSRLLTDEELENVVGGRSKEQFERWRVEYINNNSIVSSRLEKIVNHPSFNEEIK